MAEIEAAMRRLSHVFHSPQRVGCTVLAVAFLFYMGGSLIHVFASARTMQHHSTCVTNVKQLMLGLLQYSQDWDESLPPAQQWATLSGRYGHPSSEAFVWHCPDADSPYSYAFNTALGHLSLSKLDLPAQTVCLFEADANLWNAVGGPQQLAKEQRHPWGPHYGFADGHVSGYRASELSWQPVLLPIEKKP